MKKTVFLYIILLVVFGFYLPVEAEEYKIGDLIPVDQAATVHTEKFDYIDFSYSSTSFRENGDGVLSFQLIRNNNISKTAVSMNILLFGKDKKNIGFVSYCSDKDEGEHAGFKLSGGQETAFTVYVGSNYMIEGKAPHDVAFLAVYDDNRFCHTGEKDKYASKTVEEIFGNSVQTPTKKYSFFAFLKDHKIMKILLIIIGSITFLALFGIFLNVLYPKMYAGSTFLVYFPIINFFICVHMAFGKIVGFIYLGLLVVAGVLFYFHIPIVLYIVGGITLLAFLVDIIKLITKKYDLFYLEPKAKDPLADSKIQVVEIEQEPLDLSYTSEGLNAQKEEDPIQAPDPLKDVYDDVINSEHEEEGEDDFYSSEDE